MILWDKCTIQHSALGALTINHHDGSGLQIVNSSNQFGDLYLNKLTGKILDITNLLLCDNNGVTIRGGATFNAHAEFKQTGTSFVTPIVIKQYTNDNNGVSLATDGTNFLINRPIQTIGNGINYISFAPGGSGGHPFGLTSGKSTSPMPVYDLWNFSTNTVTAAGLITAQTFNATSDQRLKTNITPWSPRRSILNLPVYEFDFVRDGSHHVGCLAQDLQKICPEMVHEDQDGYLTIEESKLVYLLLDEVQRLKQEVEQLKMDCLCQTTR